MDPSPTAAESEGGSGWSGTVPVAAVLCICLVVFLIAVIFLLCLRKLLLRKGLNVRCDCCDQCCQERCTGCDCDCCITLAERFDCDTPTMNTCLDRVCPSKQVCEMWWGGCYSCHMLQDKCQTVGALCAVCLCPCGAGGACDCPDFNCCGQCCRCKLKTPDCTHINCLCCDLDCGDSSTGRH